MANKYKYYLSQIAKVLCSMPKEIKLTDVTSLFGDDKMEVCTLTENVRNKEIKMVLLEIEGGYGVPDTYFSLDRENAIKLKEFLEQFLQETMIKNID